MKYLDKIRSAILVMLFSSSCGSTSTENQKKETIKDTISAVSELKDENNKLGKRNLYYPISLELSINLTNESTKLIEKMDGNYYFKVNRNNTVADFLKVFHEATNIEDYILFGGYKPRRVSHQYYIDDKKVVNFSDQITTYIRVDGLHNLEIKNNAFGRDD